MSTYSSVRYDSLRAAANKALGELNSYSLNVIKNDLNALDVLPSDVKKNLNKSFKTVIEGTANKGSFALLKFNLEKLVKVCNKIEEYQAKEEEIREFEDSMDEDDSEDRRELKMLRKELTKIQQAITKELNKKKGTLF